MKRIISLILTVVITAGLLVSCGYSLADDKMSKYAEFDKDAFIAGCLNKIKIEDADFTADAETRAKILEDKLYTKLSAIAEEKRDGVLSAYDIIYYCYYVTFEKDGETVMFYTDKMDMSNPTNAQVGFKNTDDYTEKNPSTLKLDAVKLYEAVNGFEFKDMVKDGDTVTDYGKNYHTITSGTTKAEAGDIASITYTLEYTPEGGSKVTKTYTSQIVELKADDAFLNKFIGQAVGDVTIADAIDGKTYTSVKLNWIKDAGEEITYKDKTYTVSKKVASVNKDEYDLKDQELTYHIFPVYYKDTPTKAEADWKKVLVDVIGSELNAALIDCLWDESNKEASSVKGATTLRELVNGNDDLVSLAELVYNKSYASTDDAKKEEQTKIDERLDRIAAVVEANGLKTKITEDYEKHLYNTLAYDYNNEIKSKVAKAINDYIEKNVVVTDLPEKLVDDVYYILMQNYKNDFYTGSDDDESYYKQNDGSFEKYLVGLKSTTDSTLTFKQAKEKVKDEAETFVTYLVKLQAVAEAYDCVISDKEYKEMKYDDADSTSNVGTYGDIGVRAAYQFEKLFDTFIELKGEAEAEKEYNRQMAAAEEDESKAPRYSFAFGFSIDMDKTVTETGVVPFANIVYQIEKPKAE